MPADAAPIAIPEVQERNSERWVAIALMIASVLAIGIQLLVLALSSTPLIDQWPWLIAVNSPLGIAAGIAWGYIKQRAPKKAAIAQQVMASIWKAVVEQGGSAALVKSSILPVIANPTPPPPPEG